MFYNSKNRISFNELDRCLKFEIEDTNLIERFLEVIEEEAKEAVTNDEYGNAMEYVALINEGDKEYKKFRQPKFESDYERTASGLLEDE